MRTYRIEAQKNYYGPKVVTSVVIDADGFPRHFGTKQQAKEWIEEQASRLYYLDHNESGRPTHIIKLNPKTK